MSGERYLNVMGKIIIVCLLQKRMVEANNLIIILGIIVGGLVVSGVFYRLILWVHRLRFTPKMEKPLFARLAATVLLLLTVVTALTYAQIEVNFNLTQKVQQLLPTLLVFLLLFLAALLLTKIVVLLIDILVKKTGIMTLIRGYNQETLYGLARGIVGIILFLFFLGEALQYGGLAMGTYGRFVSYLFYPFLIFLFVIILFGTKDIIQNAGAGAYLKYAGLLKEGHYIDKENVSYKITDTFLTGVEAEKDKDRVFLSYSSLLKGFSSKKVKTEVDTLEEIKEQFIAQNPSYCGPASSSMLLKMFGYEFTQEEIGEAAKTEVSKEGEPAGTKPHDLIRAVKTLTKGKVKGVWIDADHIVDLKNEIKTWLNDDALLIIDYKKSYLFPSAKKAHYSLCLGVSDDELLVLDPSFKTGGVFYADYRKVWAGMDTTSALFNGKRGYLVFALDGSPAFRRIEEGAIYFSPSMYHHISKRILKLLGDVEEKSKHLDKVFPERLKKIAGKEKIARLWKP